MSAMRHLLNWPFGNWIQNSVCSAIILSSCCFNHSQFTRTIPLPPAINKTCRAAESPDADAGLAAAQPDLKGEHDFFTYQGPGGRRGASSSIVASCLGPKN